MGCTASTSVPSPPSTPLPNNLVFSNTWTAPPGSFCIDSISNNNAGDEDDISDLPPNSHRRTRSGYSTQLAFDPVHQRKLATLKELRDVSPKGDGSNTPPAIIRSPNTAPSSLRLKVRFATPQEHFHNIVVQSISIYRRSVNSQSLTHNKLITNV